MKSIFLFIILFTSLYGEWTHIELGAGNYGKEGYSKASQKAVIAQFSQVTKEPNYFDKLPEVGMGQYDPLEQYAVLFWTLDQLVKRYGEVGVFHVNDINEAYAHYATLKLKEYAKNQGYRSVIIQSLPGDYLTLNPEKLYTSAHLKNPELPFFNHTMDGDTFLSSIESRERARHALQQLANLSETGLYFFTIYEGTFFPDEEKREIVDKELFYHKTKDWDNVPYIFPRGHFFEKNKGIVFHIEKE